MLGCKRKKLLAPSRQARRRPFRIDEFLGTRLECQHRGLRAKLGGASLENPDHLLVPQVNTIVIAHGQNAADMALRDVVQTSD
jgi:hypothetical protein